MKLRKAKKNLAPGEKPPPVKTHLRNAIVLPEMVGSVVAIHRGGGQAGASPFTNIEIKFDMIGRYLGEFAISYKPTTHGKPGVGATKGSAHTDKT
jgi:small subunit ribosomal protein S15e